MIYQKRLSRSKGIGIIYSKLKGKRLVAKNILSSKGIQNSRRDSFPDEQMLKELITSKTALKEKLKEILLLERKTVSKRRKRKQFTGRYKHNKSRRSITYKTNWQVKAQRQ